LKIEPKKLCGDQKAMKRFGSPSGPLWTQQESSKRNRRAAVSGIRMKHRLRLGGILWGNGKEIPTEGEQRASFITGLGQEEAEEGELRRGKWKGVR